MCSSLPIPFSVVVQGVLHRLGRRGLAVLAYLRSLREHGGGLGPNRLDKKFFVYYLRKYEPSIATNTELNTVKEFIVKIIDHNVNVGLLTITDTQFITIKENDYIYNENLDNFDS
jgi:hypothetical protein